MKLNCITKIIIAGIFAGGLSLTTRAQIGSGWTPIAEDFKVQTSGSATVNGNVFSIPTTTSGTKDRAEREYATWSSGTHQFQGDCTINSFGGNGICIKQTFQKNNGPWNMVAVQNSGNIYEVSNGKSLGSFTVGKSFRINTILDCDAGTVQVYFNGQLKETLTGGQNPIYDKCGTYRLDSGTAPITATWTNVLFWQGGSSSGSPDFSLSASPSSQTVTAGNGTSYTTTVGALNGFSSAVNLTVSGLPSDATGSFNPATVTGSGSSTLTVTTTAATTPGTYTLTITGTSGSLTHTATVSLTVNPAPDFSLSASPGSITIVQGNNGTSTISVNPLNGFSGSVSLSASGLPSGVTAAFNPSGTTTTSTLTLTASSSAAVGTATVTITGTSGSLTHTTTVSLTVNPAPDFSLSASPGSVTIVQGNNGTSIISVTAINGFSGSVSLSASGLPSGVTAAFNPSGTTTTSTLTLTASSSAAVGTATVTITGISGNLTHTTTVSLTVNAASSGLPSGWTDKDIGSVGAAGSASYNSGTFTVSGSGTDISGSGDQFNYAYQSVSGDQTVIARVVSENGAQPYAKAGVMIRESVATNAVHASVLLSPTNGVAMEVRLTTGTSAINMVNWIHGVPVPQWLKLVRSGNAFTGYYSANGSTWTQIASTNVTMASSATAGLAVSAHDNTSLNTATFDNVSIAAGGLNLAGVYQIQNLASGLVLNQQGSLTNGSIISQWTVTTSSNLDWQFIATSNGYYQVNSCKSALDLAVQGASTANGAGIVQWSFGSAGDDQWKPVANGDGTYTFFNLHSGLVLENPGSSTNKATQMDQWSSNGGSNQKWNLLKQ